MFLEIVPFPCRSADQKRRHRIVASVLVGLLVLLWSTCVYAEASFQHISENVLRLHVLANSDSEADQALKLKVRDRLLTETDILLKDCGSRKEAETQITENLEILCRAAVSCVQEEGYSYPVCVRMEQTYFPTRQYDGGRLPAGVYTALRVEIGEAAGHNWWCVLFPQLCMVNAAVPEATPAASPAQTTPAASATPEPVSIETESVTLRFKLIDVFQKTKHEIKSIWTRITR